MATDVASQITNQSHDALKPIVCQIVGEDITPTGDLTATKIGRSVGLATAGIFRVTGRAQTQSEEIEWSAVVKALGSPEASPGGRQYDAFREVEVYRSQALAEICGGIRAAHCYAIQPGDEVLLLWLEDLSHAPQAPWEPKYFIATARNLGQFNAHWPEGALPRWAWLSEKGFRSEFHALFEALPARLQHQDHPLMQHFSPPYFQGLPQLWDDCDKLLVAAKGTARGICHRDCHQKNLFPMQDSEGGSYTVGIDWVKVSIERFGMDIGHLLGSATMWLEVDLDEAMSLRDPIFDAYMSGLADAGWSGNEDGVRLIYLTRLACQTMWHAAVISHAMTDADKYKRFEKLFGQPMVVVCTRYASYREFFIDCKEEALRLADGL